MPIRNTMPTSATRDGSSDGRDPRQPEGEQALQHRHGDEEPAAVEGVGQQAADEREQQQRTELREQQHADEGRRLGEVVGQRAEDDVLHPAADVRQERADEHPPEHPVAQGGPGRSGADRAVAVLQRVDGVLDRLVVRVGRARVGRHLVRSIPSTAERGRARTLTRRGDRVRGAGAPVRRGGGPTAGLRGHPRPAWARSRAARSAAASCAPSTPTTAAPAAGATPAVTEPLLLR